MQDQLKNERWKKVKEFPDYLVSNLGRIKSLKYNREKLLKLSDDGLGYPRISLSCEGKSVRERVHLLVLKTFKPTKEKLICNHKNGRKADNRLDNLEWVTYSENLVHALSTRLNKSEKPVISDLGETFRSATAAGAYFGFGPKTIASAIGRNGRSAGRKWKYIKMESKNEPTN